MTIATDTPDFRSQAFLREHIADTMAFYHPRAIDPRGGFFHYFRDDGSVYDASHRHLVSSTRFVFNYAMAAREFREDAILHRDYLEAARHGLRYLRDVRYLDRAHMLAEYMTVRQAQLAGGLVWEHYHRDWTIDWEYHKDDPKHLFRPWGFQPGHQTEWAKLLLILDGHLHARGECTAWLLPRAQDLFDRSTTAAWDPHFGGLCYGFAPDGRVCDDDKYFWVQAESLAAAARLAVRSGETRYWDWYERLWTYAWQHFVDHEHGAWYRILDRENRKYSDEKSPAGKTDYHTMGACYDVLSLLRAST